MTPSLQSRQLKMTPRRSGDNRLSNMDEQPHNQRATTKVVLLTSYVHGAAFPTSGAGGHVTYPSNGQSIPDSRNPAIGPCFVAHRRPCPQRPASTPRDLRDRPKRQISSAV